MKRRPYNHYSFFDLLYAEEQLPCREKARHRSRRYSATGLSSSALPLPAFSTWFETPFAGGSMPGIQIHAAVADDFLSNRFHAARSREAPALRLSSRWRSASAFSRNHPAGMVGGCGLCSDRQQLFAFVATRQFAGGNWINITQPTLASSLALFGGVEISISSKGEKSGR